MLQHIDQSDSCIGVCSPESTYVYLYMYIFSLSHGELVFCTISTGLLAKLDIQEAYSSVKNVQIVIISTIIVFAFVGVMASLGLAKVTS